jgi:hypothetical protein
MQRKLSVLLAGLFITLSFGSPASAQCVTIGAKLCQSGYIYVCEPCGSEKCWIATSTRCYRDEPREEFFRSALPSSGFGLAETLGQKRSSQTYMRIAEGEQSSTGTVEQPENVTGAGTDEGAAERAGAGFDTPWTSESYNDGKADNLEPAPLVVTPNE